MNTQPPAVITYEFTRADGTDPQPFNVAAPTLAIARDRISQAHDYKHTGKVTRTPYTWHARAAGICAALAELTGAEWTPRPVSDEYPDSSFDLGRADGLTLYFNAPSKYEEERRPGAAQFAFSLDTPRRAGLYIEAYAMTPNGWQRITSPTIRATQQKTDAQLARDIARRLLPDAEKHHTATLERIAALDAADNAQADSAAAVAAALGVSLRTDYHTKKTATDGSLGRLDFKAHEGGNVDFTARSLPRAVAVQFAAAVAAIIADDTLAKPANR